MSMSMHVYGFKPPDETWSKMKAIWDACAKADIEAPDEVYEFFEGEPPDDAGVVVKLDEHMLREYRGDMQEGFEIHLEELPDDVTVIRFVNSY